MPATTTVAGLDGEGCIKFKAKTAAQTAIQAIVNTIPANMIQMTRFEGRDLFIGESGTG